MSHQSYRRRVSSSTSSSSWSKRSTSYTQNASAVTTAVQQLVERANKAEQEAREESLKHHSCAAQLQHKTEEYEVLLEKFKQLQNSLVTLQRRDKDRESLLHVTLRKLEAIQLGNTTETLKVDSTANQLERARKKESRASVRCFELENKLREINKENAKLRCQLEQLNFKLRASEAAAQLAEERSEEIQKELNASNRKLARTELTISNMSEENEKFREELSNSNFKHTAAAQQLDRALEENGELLAELEEARSAFRNVFAIASAPVH